LLRAEPEAVIRRRILIVEDDEGAGQQLKRLLELDQGLEVALAANGQQALQCLREDNYSIVITDLRMPGLDGLDLIREIQRLHLNATAIVMTAFGGVDEAIQAIRLGAYDFLTKPIDVTNLRLLLARALRERELKDEVLALRRELKTRFSFHNIISKSPRMHAIFELINNIGDTNTTVLIEGETGTGKEQLARAIHSASSNRSSPLVAINCTAVPESLLESELFGHEKGAFTSAVSQRKGRFEMANGGTLFLDEIADIPAPMQAKLLRVLQERRFERIGGTQSIDVDVRILAATNRSLKRMVKQGTFREDLYYRLNVVRIELPPLRERPEDIPLLAEHFAEKYARVGEAPKKFSTGAMQRLLQYSWPGNVRELENLVERMSVTSRRNVIEEDDLPGELNSAHPSFGSVHIDLSRPLRSLLQEVTAYVEKQYILKALRKTRGHVGRAAKMCGYCRRSITAKIAEYQLDRSAFSES